jgi:predicted dehydrogenase
MARMPIAVIGAGLIGKTHVDRAFHHSEVALTGIAEPSPAGRQLAQSLGVPWFAGYEELLDKAKPRGAVIATPNATHADIAVKCLERGVAVVVEKPVADDVAQAKRICAAAEKSGQPALVGHQRRYNVIARRAKELIATGKLGRPVCATVLCTWLKPPGYFDTAWRREAGGGPVLINLIHDIDLLRFLFGEVVEVQAFASNAVRGFVVEDTAAIVLRMGNGALATITLSDTATAPWNWDLAAGEAERFPRREVDAFFLSGTEGSLTLPRLEFWNYRQGRGWEEPLSVERQVPKPACPYAEQLRHFRALVEGKEPPVCSAADATRSLEATLAVRAAAASGRPVQLG